MKSKFLFISLCLSLLTPFVIILSVLRLVMTPPMLELEYRMPGFPDDPYGFSQAERLRWSKFSMDYLLSNQHIDYFDQFSLSDGSPLYNERELSHMDDVKRLVTAGRNIWLAILVIFISLTIYAYLKRNEQAWYKGIRNGSYLTLGLILLLLLSTVMDFNQLFTQFHALFFTGDSWIFYYSDTFIRLFPIRFWMDSFIYVGVLSALIAIILVIISRKKMSV